MLSAAKSAVLGGQLACKGFQGTRPVSAKGKHSLY